MITILTEGKTGYGNGYVRLIEPTVLANPFKSDHRVTPAECAIAYDGWLRGRIEQGDKFVIAELERIAQYANTKTGAFLIGSRKDCEVVKALVEQALNQEE